MNSQQIYTILKNDANLEELNFLGVFAIDLIPMTALKFPCAMVINTKPQNHTGEHWIAVVKTEEKQGIYFDSFGMPPYNLTEVVDVLDNCEDWSFNNTRLQSTYSTVCGEYCIFFLTYFARGFSMEHITYILNNNNDLYTNDALVHNYVKNKYAELEGANTSSLQIIDFPFVFNQISSLVTI